ncbi:amine oxidase [Ophiostoma piceae UAMH 11346]|uniref:Amine oxidase n=1 Tax=Ophiostoma piceae (strain UAMH 11346) TaxID=1262450 RepID=S3C1N1_OPHP1|nr:amine oxidase [Ophiostoma piceae UAMH 11346]
MDVYSVFSSSAARRDSTRLDLDLKSIRRYSLSAGDEPRAESTRPPGHKMPHVGIVGAGIAGLRCANILLQRGFQVTVLEGRNRLGGRLHQARLSPIPSSNHAGTQGTDLPLVDMGPNWIHGTKDNPILDIVHATDTATSSHDVDEQGNHLTGAVFDQDGHLLPLEEGEALSTVMWKIVEEAFVHSNSNCSTIDANESLRDFFQQRLEAHVPSAGVSDASVVKRRQEMVMQIADFWGAFVGSPVSRQSLKYYWLEECIEGENLFCAWTYKKVLDRLSEPVTAGASIHYGQTVSRIETYKNNARKLSNTTKPGVQVVTSTGNNYSFDEVVCTTPLGWLKKNAVAAFSPPLPDRLLQAVDSIGYGCLEKVYISFAEAFWHRPDPETGRIVRGFYQWLAPGVYAQPSNPEHLSQEAVDLASLPGPAAHPTLLFYIFGRQSQIITDKLAELRDEEDSKTAASRTDELSETTAPNSKQAAFLLDYFQPYFGTLPNYDPVSPACAPTACLATNWLHDDLAGNGSYSNFQVGLTAGDEDIRLMREGLPERRLWFAGEHTAPFVALGTATGAYWSGESVGRRIVEAYGQQRVSISEQATVTEAAESMPESSIRDAALVSS